MGAFTFQDSALQFWRVLCLMVSLKNRVPMLKQVQTQKQQHTILPQQIELLNLFHLNRLELDQRIQDELSENPALEELGSGDDLSTDKFSKDTVQDFQG